MTSQRQREMYLVGRWGRPPRPFMGDERRWRRFRNAIFQRMAELRESEPVDSRVAPWQAFETPLPSAQPVALRPVRLRLGPPSTTPRDAQGRFLARLEQAS